MFKKTTTLTFSIIFLLVISAFADEGMWMLHLLKQQKLSDMKEMGLKLEDYDIYNPDGSSLKDAVVQFGRGCTGEVISSQGLVLTNHHCGYGQIQSHSTLENNYLEDGFLARTKADELPNEGLTVTFVDRIEDVTDYVRAALERDKDQDTDGVLYMSPSYLDKIAREKVGEEFLANRGAAVELKHFFEGNQYFLFFKKIYSDIRLVAAPPSSIGKFGADTDNWTWPRHTGDFSIFRIYADKDGNPAEYSESNVPLKPKRWLTISTKGAEENEFAMILGFPGTTNKFYTSWEVEERRDIDNNVQINMRNVKQEVMLNEMLSDPQVKIQYASKYSGSTNAYKRAMGSNWAIDMRDFEGSKREQQERLIEWANSNNRPEYIEALNTIEDIVMNKRSDLRFRSMMLNEGITLGMEFARVPLGSYEALLSVLTLKDKKVRKNALEGLQNDYADFADKDYSPMVDKKVSKAMLREYTKLIAPDKQPAYFSIIYDKFGGDTDRFIDYLFDTSIFGSKKNLDAFVAKPSLKKLNKDPMFSFAVSVRSERHNLTAQQSAYNNDFSLARRKYVQGILEMDGPIAYAPDANLTLRLAYGQLKGYVPHDAVYYYHQTTLDGIMEKEDPDNWEFVVPAKLKELYANSDFGQYGMKDGRMPVNFAASTHTTGGNSGSPVMNSNGELIGINFDRNWEGVGGDIQYLPDYQRSIIVDIRYVLFVVDKYLGAQHLIDELELN